MKIIDEIKGVTESAKESAEVSLNAARDAYVLLESKRKGNEKELLQEAVDLYCAKHGCSVAKGFEEVGKRASYLEELTTGETTFYKAKEQLENKSEQTVLA
ncbi:hypothetical protein [Methylocucumis oryzae]|uniref:Uncharacterized protein n=1 Tax=Methylocucumis oryzae TaxID=1632867 RepID=A0A0F3IG15_9GAMM|nr:hypothetical protein [Methylocucumis oryzae]KJV05740.1 hypothetical protein VZ94_15920 [Methylocucumis oryzae]